MKTKIALILASMAAVVLLAGCYTATDAANEARQECRAHKGVASIQFQRSFVHRYGVWACKDGKVGAHDG